MIRLLLFVALLSGCVSHTSVNPGPRAADLIQGLPVDSPLRARLAQCADGPFQRTDFSISHRGAPLGYPEHTREGYLAAAAMGAGLIECDVIVTRDLARVCRHSQCDLHRTTNILATQLADRCHSPFTPASGDQPASAQCCTTDITLDEFRTLCGRRDQVNDRATSVADYLTAPPPRVDVDAAACGRLMTHADSIELLDSQGVKFVPELKNLEPDVPPPPGFSHQAYASAMLEDYRQAGIDPDRVFPQSFNLQDILFWIDQHPDFAATAVYLDPRGRDPDFRPTLEGMRALYAKGVRTLAPPMPMLLVVDERGELQASPYAKLAHEAGLRLITWTFEAGDPTDPSNWMYANLRGWMESESTSLEVLDALAMKARIAGIFSDWPGTVTYYANCVGR